MLGLAITVALLLALAFSGRRLWLRRRFARLLASVEGGAPHNAVRVDSFGDIDDEVRERRCPCGGRYEVHGEGSREHGGRRLRVLRVECSSCERRGEMFFDVTELFH